jgi:hypothetical protein
MLVVKKQGGGGKYVMRKQKLENDRSAIINTTHTSTLTSDL